MDYTAAVAWLDRFHLCRSPFGLTRIAQLLTILDEPQRQYPSVLVAGTNGKGSVTAMLEAIVQASGEYQAGATISPHLRVVSERVRLLGRDIDEATFVKGVAALQEPVEALCGAGGAGEPSFFELVTALAFWAFREAEIDLAIVECGLGGRLDATNVLTPEVAVITQIGTDHQEVLGATRTAIAGEKVAIVKKRGELVTGETDPGLLELFETHCQSVKAKLFKAGMPGWLRVLHSDARGHRLAIDEAGECDLLLPGRHQLLNLAIALTALERLRAHGFALSPAAVAAGLVKVRWPGRLQWGRLPDGLPVLLDGAHNAEGLAALVAYLREFPPPRPLHLVLGALHGKPVAAMAEALAGIADTLAFVPPSSGRALSKAEFAVEVAPGDSRWAWHDRLGRRLTAPEGTACVLVTGSLYLVAEGLRHLAAEP